MDTVEASPSRRPRVANDREAAILDATLSVLVQVGYDRLTMDLVAAEARAGKATLYRHWSGKAELVVDAISRAKGMPNDAVVDTGSLRGDLNATWCGKSGWSQRVPMSVMGGLLTAVHTDPSLATAFRERFLVPRIAVARKIYEQSASRGEMTEAVDIDLLMSVLPAMCLYREVVLGQPVDEAFVNHVIDDVLMPATGVSPTK
jgi:AcrR family transcriptional regulator